ncbi:hypothetical protein CYMTET_31311, partial [Cymbomonas tetramitiformis]
MGQAGSGGLSQEEEQKWATAEKSSEATVLRWQVQLLPTSYQPLEPPPPSLVTRRDQSVIIGEHSCTHSAPSSGHVCQWLPVAASRESAGITPQSWRRSNLLPVSVAHLRPGSGARGSCWRARALLGFRGALMGGACRADAVQRASANGGTAGLARIRAINGRDEFPMHRRLEQHRVRPRGWKPSGMEARCAGLAMRASRGGKALPGAPAPARVRARAARVPADSSSLRGSQLQDDARHTQERLGVLRGELEVAQQAQTISQAAQESEHETWAQALSHSVEECTQVVSEREALEDELTQLKLELQTTLLSKDEMKDEVDIALHGLRMVEVECKHAQEKAGSSQARIELLEQEKGVALNRMQLAEDRWRKAIVSSPGRREAPANVPAGWPVPRWNPDAGGALSMYCDTCRRVLQPSAAAPARAEVEDQLRQMLKLESRCAKAEGQCAKAEGQCAKAEAAQQAVESQQRELATAESSLMVQVGKLEHEIDVSQTKAEQAKRQGQVELEVARTRAQEEERAGDSLKRQAARAEAELLEMR